MSKLLDRRAFLEIFAGIFASGMAEAHGIRGFRMRRSVSKKILIIGAGVAGLTTARELVQAGHTVKILEARDRVGGRVHTFHDLSAPVELGATWLHGGPGNPLKGIFSSLGIQKKAYDATQFAIGRTDSEGSEAVVHYPLQNAPWVDREFSKALKRATILKLLTDFHPNVAEVLHLAEKRIYKHLPQVSLDEKKETLWLFEKYLETDLAEDLDQASIRELMIESITDPQGEILPLGEEMVFGGMDQFIQHLSQGLSISTNQIVKKISYGMDLNDQVKVQTQEQTFEADAVIVTVPLSVLKAGAIDFEPILPRQHQNAIEGLGMGLLNKVILEFPDSTWMPSAQFLSVYPNENPTCSFHVNLNEYAQKPILIGFAGGSRARTLESKTDEDVVRETLDELRRGFGGNSSNLVPVPIRAHVTRWGKDPYSLGSYSGHVVGSSSAERSHLQVSLNGKLFFAGEATDVHDYGTVHAAYWSGLRVASYF